VVVACRAAIGEMVMTERPRIVDVFMLYRIMLKIPSESVGLTQEKFPLAPRSYNIYSSHYPWKDNFEVGDDEPSPSAEYVVNEFCS
jgi:hypothetical protein